MTKSVLKIRPQETVKNELPFILHIGIRINKNLNVEQRKWKERGKHKGDINTGRRRKLQMVKLKERSVGVTINWSVQIVIENRIYVCQMIEILALMLQKIIQISNFNFTATYNKIWY